MRRETPERFGPRRLGWPYTGGVPLLVMMGVAQLQQGLIAFRWPGYYIPFGIILAFFLGVLIGLPGVLAALLINYVLGKRNVGRRLKCVLSTSFALIVMGVISWLYCTQLVAGAWLYAIGVFAIIPGGCIALFFRPPGLPRPA